MPKNNFTRRVRKMKKLLSILLAAATVFSTTAFASPAAEPIESADEISLDVGGGSILRVLTMLRSPRKPQVIMTRHSA